MTRKSIYEEHADLIWENIHKRVSYKDIVTIIGVGGHRWLETWANRKWWGHKLLWVHHIKNAR